MPKTIRPIFNRLYNGRQLSLNPQAQAQSAGLKELEPQKTENVTIVLKPRMG